MRRLSRLAASTFLIAITLGAAAADAPEVAAARKAVEAQDYRGALQKVAEALARQDVSPEEQYDLLMLRGEALLRLNERTYAIDAFNAASRAAGRERLKEAAAARANAVLIEHSQGAAYKPRGGAGEPIPIVPPDSRKRAMAALFEDLLGENMPKIKAALEGKELPPMLAVVPVLGEAYVLEWTATGEPKRVAEVLKSFGQHARSLMLSELTRVERRVAALERMANTPVTSPGVWGTAIDRRGLWSPERRELQEQIAYVR